jgi:hypothetical protein
MCHLAACGQKPFPLTPPSAACICFRCGPDAARLRAEPTNPDRTPRTWFERPVSANRHRPLARSLGRNTHSGKRCVNRLAEHGHRDTLRMVISRKGSYGAGRTAISRGDNFPCSRCNRGHVAATQAGTVAHRDDFYQLPRFWSLRERVAKVFRQPSRCACLPVNDERASGRLGSHLRRPLDGLFGGRNVTVHKRLATDETAQEPQDHPSVGV